VIIAYGTAARIAKSAVTVARESGGIKLGLLRPITLWPFPTKAIADLAADKQDILVTEMSFGQLYEDVRLSVCGKAKVSLLAHTGGGLPTEEEIIETAGKSVASSEPLEVYPVFD
jgi:2-oxoglutarate ferredoxin oxidoreductase subunit alpha